MRLSLYFTITAMMLACTKQHQEASHTQYTTAVDTSRAQTVQSVPEDDTLSGEDDCVFDTSAYQFTTEAIIKYNKDLSFVWNKASASAHTKLSDTDSLILHIGGCYHFSYDATFITDSSKFSDQHFLLQKTRWLAKNFFSNGFDDKYVHCIENNLYTLEDSTQKDYRYYTIKDPADTAVTDHIYEGWTFKKENGKTVINIVGYVN